MKTLTTLVLVMLCAGVAFAGRPHEHKHGRQTPINPAYGIARGFANVMTGWLEIPRGLIYENARIPVVGFVSGPVKGAFLTTWREVAGLTDVVTFGLTGKGLYYRDVVPDFVWDARWIPVPKETYAVPQPRGKHGKELKKCGKKEWRCEKGKEKGWRGKGCPPPCPPPCPPAHECGCR